MPTSAIPVLDGVQLKRRTMGDGALQVEVLALFVAELERLMHQLEGATEPRVREDRLQAIIELARDVGAARLAQAARMLETHIGSEQPDLEPLRTAVAETLAVIGQTDL